MLTFEEKLYNYASIGLLHGLGYDQTLRSHLYVDAYQTEDHGFLPILARAAYDLGVKTVDVHYRNPELERAQVLGAPEDYKLYFPRHVGVRAKELVDRDGARIALIGNADLGLFDDVPAKYPSGLKSAYFEANEPMTTRRMQMLQPWTILDVPSSAWAKKLGMNIEDLWEFLFHVTGADQERCVEYARGVNESLHARCAVLNQLDAGMLHFLGKGTDLKVGLSKKAVWLGGRKEAEDGTWFEPNWPSFEVFTTPDWRNVRGAVRVTMPTVIGGSVVHDLSIWFKEGRVVNFTASDGGPTFEALISHDEGASRLGEIAMVGLDAPLSAYPEPHFCGMLDENKRCHMALGQAYAACIDGGPHMSKEELESIGCNDSGVHHDMMISDETTSVYALDANGRYIAQLMKDGRWLPPFDGKQ